MATSGLGPSPAGWTFPLPIERPDQLSPSRPAIGSEGQTQPRCLVTTKRVAAILTDRGSRCKPAPGTGCRDLSMTSVRSANGGF